MPFRPTNAPATFQAYIDDCLRGFVDEFVICYLDDILIYSHTKEDHEEHVRKVLNRLQEFGLYCNTAKCEFGVRTIGFLGFVVREDGVSMEYNRITAIEDWPAPKNIKNVQVFLGFANFYRRFIKNYAKKSAPISDLLKGQDAVSKRKKKGEKEKLKAKTKPKPAF